MLLIAGWILLVALLLISLLWSLAYVYVSRATSGLPSVADALDSQAPDSGWPKLSIIVPAHNEQDIIGRCLGSLRQADYENLQIVVVLDRCTDQTAAIVGEHAHDDDRIRVVKIESLHDDWHGKCYPMQRGSEHADGQWLLFVDADTQFDPCLPRAAVSSAICNGFAMMGVLPQLRCELPFEYIAQPVAQLLLMHIFPPNKVNRRGKSRPFGIGPFIMVHRETFERAGGMATIKDQYQEDVNLARAIDGVGGNVGVVLSGGLFKCAMYDSLRGFVQGWKRIFIGCCNRKVKRLRKYGLRMMSAGVALPVFQLAAVLFGCVAASGGQTTLAVAIFAAVGLCWIGQAVLLRRLYTLANAPFIAAAAFPLGCAIVGWILLRSASDLKNRVPIRWGGREYVVEQR